MILRSEDLAVYPLCKGLSELELRQVTRLLRRVAFLPGSLVMGQEQPGNEAYLVATGTLHVTVDQPDGEHVIVAILGPYALVGEMSVVQSAGRSASVVVAERALLLTIYRDDFHACLQAIPQLAHNLTTLLAQRLRLANAQIITLATKDPTARIARTLRTFAAEHGQLVPDGRVLIPYRLTQSDLGRIVNLARASVNRSMRILTEANVISVDARYRITIHDLAMLDTFAP